MANQPFDYTIINALERPTSSDLNQAQGQAHADVRLLARQLFQVPGDTTGAQGFVGDSFKVVPTAPTSMTVVISRGIGFQNGATETNIGGVTGLNDSFDYKPLGIQDRTIPVVAAPAAGYRRFDLIQVRALATTERLTNSQSKDIYNPSLNSFNATSVYKTLTSDLTDVAVQTIAYTDTGTDPVVYKTGEPIFGLDPDVYPSVDAGYLPLAYIAINSGTTSIGAGNISDQRYRLRNSQTAGGMPPVGSVNQVIVSNGTDWEANDPPYIAGYTEQSGTTTVASASWTAVPALTKAAIDLRNGLVRIRLQPTSSNPFFPIDTSRIFGENTTGIPQTIYIKFEIDGLTVGSNNTVFVFNHALAANAEGTIPLPALEWEVAAGTYDIKVAAKATDSSVNINFTDLTLFVGQ